MKLLFVLCMAHMVNNVLSQLIWTGLPIWAKQCDFRGNDFANVTNTADSRCSTTCRTRAGCSHFSWTSQNGGTCWLKQGRIKREDAILSNDPTMICGIVLEGDFVLRKGPLLWADEFNSIDVLNQNWNQQIGGDGWGNNERQYYTGENRNTIIKDGFLTIQARNERYVNRNFTSARLKTFQSFKYGVFEMRAKLPTGRGTWPAFWLLAATIPLKWPDDGEIDIMEHVGYDQDIIYATIHCRNHFHGENTQIGNKVLKRNASDEFNIYQIEWTPTSIKGFLNDIYYFKYDRPVLPTYQNWPFDNNFNLILNFAVGGDWGGAAGIDESVFPQDYIIDYVRVYDHV